MLSPVNLTHLDTFIPPIREYFFSQVLSWSMAAQLACAGCLLLAAYRITRAIRSWCRRQQDLCKTQQQPCADLDHVITFLKAVRPFLAFVFVGFAWRLAGHFHWPRDGLYTAAMILIAVALVRFFTGQMHNRLWARVIATAVWVLAFLYIFHLIDPWLLFLEHIDFHFGGFHLSLLHLQRGLILLLTLYWLSKNLRTFIHFWLAVRSDLTPAAQILFSRLTSIVLFSASVVIVLHYLGLDLTVFALFSGALGLGLGFGLQKVFANLVSGFILLADKSIKPGDVIQLQDKYGWINFLGSRYCSVVTRDGIEHLIPNENLITGEVINWSYSEDLVRLKIPVGVAYESDLEKARELMLAAATDTARVLPAPQPACLITGFGDNAINLELRVWINDPQNGIASIKSNLYWGIWRRFQEHGINMPYPQRDLHLKSMPEIKIHPGPEDG